MIPTIVKLGIVIYFLFLFTKIVDGNERNPGNSLTMDTKIPLCSRALATLLYQICSGGVKISDLPSNSLTVVRGKRAAVLFKDRLKRQIADECCLNTCSVSQIIQYCPDTW